MNWTAAIHAAANLCGVCAIILGALVGYVIVMGAPMATRDDDDGLGKVLTLAFVLGLLSCLRFL